MATRDQEHGLTLNVNAVCTNNNEQELLKLYFDNADIFADTSVLEIKLKLQDLLNAPVCIQQLSYLDQTLIDPETKLADLYVRQGETLYVKYLAKVDITRLNDCINMLRKFESLLSQLCTSDGRHVCVPSVNDVEKVEDLYADLFDPLETLSHIFGQWKTVPVQAVRRYFVQEKGLDYLMEINAFSKKEYTWFTQSMKENPPTLSINNDDGEEDNMADQDEQLFMR